MPRCSGSMAFCVRHSLFPLHHGDFQRVIDVVHCLNAFSHAKGCFEVEDTAQWHFGKWLAGSDGDVGLRIDLCHFVGR